MTGGLFESVLRIMQMTTPGTQAKKAQGIGKADSQAVRDSRPSVGEDNGTNCNVADPPGKCATEPPTATRQDIV